MPYVDNQGIRIHYKVEGQGPPLQHGEYIESPGIVSKRLC